MLIRVKYVRAEEERNHAEDPDLQHRLHPHLERGLERRGLVLNGDLRHVDQGRFADQEGESPAKGHDDEEGDVGAIADGADGGIVVQAEGDEGADGAAEVEDDPEDGDGAAFLVLGDVGGHYGALGDPEEGGAYTEDAAGGDDEGCVLCIWMRVRTRCGLGFGLVASLRL